MRPAGLFAVIFVWVSHGFEVDGGGLSTGDGMFNTVTLVGGKFDRDASELII